MTVALIWTLQRWLGLSSDAKPTSPPPGSTFLEIDSGLTYVYNGSAWSPVSPVGVPSWAVTQDSAANTSQTLSKAAVAAKRHYLLACEVVISAAAVGTADIVVTVQDGGTVLWKSIVGAGAPRGERVGVVFSQPLQCSVNTAAQVVVGAGGASVVTTANLCGYTV